MPRLTHRHRRPAVLAAAAWLAVGLGCSTSLPGGAPTDTPTPAPTATAIADPADEPTGGFGASSAWWDAHYERTGTIDDGFVYADLYEVQFARDHARWLRVAFTEDRVVSGSEVEALARSLMPDDAANNCDFDPRVANEPDAFFFSCWSIWLSYQFDEAAWQGAPNGSLLVLYTLRNDRVESLVLTTGHPP